MYLLILDTLYVLVLLPDMKQFWTGNFDEGPILKCHVQFVIEEIDAQWLHIRFSTC